MTDCSSQYQVALLVEVYQLLAVTYEELCDKGCRVGWDEETDVGVCGETCMRDMGCSNLPVMANQKYEAGHSETVLSEEG